MRFALKLNHGGRTKAYLYRDAINTRSGYNYDNAIGSFDLRDVKDLYRAMTTLIIQNPDTFADDGSLKPKPKRVWIEVQYDETQSQPIVLDAPGVQVIQRVPVPDAPLLPEPAFPYPRDNDPADW